MIRAVRAGISKEHKLLMKKEVENLMEEYHLNPTLYRMLVESGDLKKD